LASWPLGLVAERLHGNGRPVAQKVERSKTWATGRSSRYRLA